MNEQISPGGSDFNPTPTKKPRSFRLIFIGLGIVVVIFVLWFIYLVFFSPDARRDFETRKNYNQAMKAINEYEKAMQNDTYGGKTPQETLNLFISALEKEDIELASKYFILRDDGSQNLQWLDGLRKAKEGNKILEMIGFLKNAKSAGSSMDGYFGFEIRDEKKNLISDLGMVFNKYSGVWKIESM